MAELSGPRGPQPEKPAAKLFEITLRRSPAASESIAELLGNIAVEVCRRGGHLSVATDGPNQGITIEVDGTVRRFNPSAPADAEDIAIVGGALKRLASGLRPTELKDSLDIYLETLRVFTLTEAELRARL